MGQFNHRVPWFDEEITTVGASSHRLYRFFELVETRSRMGGMDPAIFQISPQNSAITAGGWQCDSSSEPNHVHCQWGAKVSINTGDVLTIVGNFDGSSNLIMENVRVSGVTTSPSPRITLAAGSNGTAVPYQPFSSAMLVHTATGGLIAGKINLNNVFDAEIFSALPRRIDRQQVPANSDVGTIFSSPHRVRVHKRHVI